MIFVRVVSIRTLHPLARSVACLAACLCLCGSVAIAQRQQIDSTVEAGGPALDVRQVVVHRAETKAPGGANAPMGTVVATSLVLASGINVHVRSMTDSKAPGRVFVAMTVPGLEATETRANRGATELAAALIELPEGLQNFGAAQTPEGILVSGSCSPAQLRAVLASLAELLAAPRLRQNTFETYRNDLAAKREERKDKPAERIASALLTAMMPADDARVKNPTPEDLLRLTEQDITQFIVSEFRRRSVDVGIAGNVALAEVIPLLAPLSTLAPRPRDALAELRAIARVPMGQLVDAAQTRNLPPLDVNQVQDLGVGDGESRVKANVKGRVMQFTGPTGAGNILLRVSVPGPAQSELIAARRALVASKAVALELTKALHEHNIPLVLPISGGSLPGRLYPNLGTSSISMLVQLEPARSQELVMVIDRAIDKLLTTPIDQAIAADAEREARLEAERIVTSAEYWARSMSVAWFLDVPITQIGLAPQTYQDMRSEHIDESIRQFWTPSERMYVVVKGQQP